MAEANDASEREASEPRQAPSPPPQRRLRTLPLRAKYRGEEQRGVLYFEGEARARHEVTFREGRLWGADGQPVNAGHALPPETEPTFPEGDGPHDPSRWGFAIYALDAAGRLYLSFESQRGRVHHSSLLAGEPTACAGEMIIFDGRLLALNNQSGHYQPPPAALQQLLTILREGGIDISQVRVQRFGVDLFPGGPGF